MNNPEHIAAVRRAQLYIEAHLGEHMTLRELADDVGYSQWHFARIFAELVGKAPLEYIRARRLSEAAIRLRSEGAGIIETALDFAFDSHEGFTRAFTREFGVTPWKCKSSPEPMTLFLFSELRGAYRTVSLYRKEGKQIMAEKTRTVFVQVVERPERKCIVKWGKTARDYFAYCGEVGCEVWDILCGIKDALYEPAGMWFPETMRPKGTSEYAHALEVPLDYSGEIPAGFDVAVLPACTMMVFQGEPYERDEDYCLAVDEVCRHIGTFDPKLYGYEWAPESAPRFQLAPMMWRGYIEARPVRKL